MHSTTESPTFPVGTLPPPTLARPKTPPNVISQAPVLPLVVAAVPAPAHGVPVASPFATSLNPAPPQRPVHKKAGGGGRRFLSWMLLLAALGGITYAAITYGPELMERAGGETVDEPEAPLAFPVIAVAPPPIRTATYTVERPGVDGATTYTVTSDFESGLSRMTIDRVDATDIEMMAVFDEAVIRLIDQPSWYRVQRGEFPLEAFQGRTRFVRTLDELLPPEVRSLATIERSTVSSIANVPTRRMLVSIDPQRLNQVLVAPLPPVEPDPAADPAAAPVPAPAVALPPGVALAADADLREPLQIELWIDDNGLVRKAILPAALGGETITVTSVSSEAFQVGYPAPEQVQPLTANALLSLGL